MNLDLELVCDRYAETYGASIELTYRQFLTRAGLDGPLAVSALPVALCVARGVII